MFVLFHILEKTYLNIYGKYLINIHFGTRGNSLGFISNNIHKAIKAYLQSIRNLFLIVTKHFFSLITGILRYIIFFLTQPFYFLLNL